MTNDTPSDCFLHVLPRRIRRQHTHAMMPVRRAFFEFVRFVGDGDADATGAAALERAIFTDSHALAVQSFFFEFLRFDLL